MGEVSALKKMHVAVFAAFIALVMGFSLSLTANKAFADEGLQAGEADLAEQIQNPTTTEELNHLYPGQICVVTLTNDTHNDLGEYQTGTWEVTSNDESIAQVTKFEPPTWSNDKSESFLNVTVKGVAYGKTTITATFTTDKDVTGEFTFDVVVTGLRVGQVYTDEATGLKFQVRSNWAKNNKGAVKVIGVNADTKSAEAIEVPRDIVINERTYSVVMIAKGAFKDMPNLKKFTCKKLVRMIGAKAFANDKNLKTIRLQTKRLTEKGVANSLKASSVKTVKVPKLMEPDYKNYFSADNCGADVTVKAYNN